MKKKHIAILGSTGSIGTQALEVIAANSDTLVAEILTANTQSDLLIEQAKRFQPNAVVIADETQYEYVKNGLKEDPDIKVFTGTVALEQVVQMTTVDVVLNSLVGFSGLKPTLCAIEAGKDIALANKETLVVAGDLVIEAAGRKNVNIYPVDSEHSAIFQCLVGEIHNPVKYIHLTASGGPFLGKTRSELAAVKAADALKHPNWNMGKKVTIDSATLMNKGLEVIEAYWLFGIAAEKINVLVHPQSIVHSMVEFSDGSIKAQLGAPDMRLPIQYALSFPKRFETSFSPLSFAKYSTLTFAAPDTETFPALLLAYEALKRKGNVACVMNAANEVAVDAFLHGKINFLSISDVIDRAMQTISFVKDPSLDDYLQTDLETRSRVIEYISNNSNKL